MADVPNPAPLHVSTQDLDGDVGETAQASIMGEEEVASRLDRRGQVERVGEPVTTRGTDLAGPIEGRWGEGEDNDVRRGEEGIELRQGHLIARSNGPDATFQAGQVADRHASLLRPDRPDPRRRPR